MKELTFGEAAEIKRKVEEERPDAEIMHYILAAYEEGYRAAQKEEVSR